MTFKYHKGNAKKIQQNIQGAKEIKSRYLLLASQSMYISKSSDSCWTQYVAIDLFISDNVEYNLKL
jgi:hypothetical protein